AALASVRLQQRRFADAVAAAQQALARSNAVKIRFLAARVFVEAGAPEQATALAGGLAAALNAEPRAYAAIIDGELAFESKDYRTAAKLFSEANMLQDTWIGHFDLGRAFLEAGAFTEADSEFDRCLKRRGETLALF